MSKKLVKAAILESRIKDFINNTYIPAVSTFNFFSEKVFTKIIEKISEIVFRTLHLSQDDVLKKIKEKFTILEKFIPKDISDFIFNKYIIELRNCFIVKDNDKPIREFQEDYIYKIDKYDYDKLVRVIKDNKKTKVPIRFSIYTTYPITCGYPQCDNYSFKNQRNEGVCGLAEFKSSTIKNNQFNFEYELNRRFSKYEISELKRAAKDYAINTNNIKQDSCNQQKNLSLINDAMNKSLMDLYSYGNEYSNLLSYVPTDPLDNSNASIICSAKTKLQSSSVIEDYNSLFSQSINTINLLANNEFVFNEEMFDKLITVFDTNLSNTILDKAGFNDCIEKESKYIDSIGKFKPLTVGIKEHENRKISLIMKQLLAQRVQVQIIYENLKDLNISDSEVKKLLQSVIKGDVNKTTGEISKIQEKIKKSTENANDISEKIKKAEETDDPGIIANTLDSLKDVASSLGGSIGNKLENIGGIIKNGGGALLENAIDSLSALGEITNKIGDLNTLLDSGKMLAGISSLANNKLGSGYNSILNNVKKSLDGTLNASALPSNLITTIVPNGGIQGLIDSSQGNIKSLLAGSSNPANMINEITNISNELFNDLKSSVTGPISDASKFIGEKATSIMNGSLDFIDKATNRVEEDGSDMFDDIPEFNPDILDEDTKFEPEILDNVIENTDEIFGNAMKIDSNKSKNNNLLLRTSKSFNTSDINNKVIKLSLLDKLTKLKNKIYERTIDVLAAIMGSGIDKIELQNSEKSKELINGKSSVDAAADVVSDIIISTNSFIKSNENTYEIFINKKME